MGHKVHDKETHAWSRQAEKGGGQTRGPDDDVGACMLIFKKILSTSTLRGKKYSYHGVRGHPRGGTRIGSEDMKERTEKLSGGGGGLGIYPSTHD